MGRRAGCTAAARDFYAGEADSFCCGGGGSSGESSRGSCFGDGLPGGVRRPAEDAKKKQKHNDCKPKIFAVLARIVIHGASTYTKPSQG